MKKNIRGKFFKKKNEKKILIFKKNEFFLKQGKRIQGKRKTKELDFPPKTTKIAPPQTKNLLVFPPKTSTFFWIRWDKFFSNAKKF